MSSRSVSLLLPFRWLMESLAFSGAQKMQLLLAVQFVVVAMFTPSLVQGLLGPSMGVQVFALVLGIVFVPPLIVGVLRLFDLEQQGQSFHAREALKIFQQPSRWMASVVLHTLNLALMVAVLGSLLSAFIGEDYLRELLQIMQTAQPGKPPQLPALPEGAAAGIALMLVCAALLGSLQYLSYAHYAKSGESVFKSWVQALLGVIKNSATLLLFYLFAGITTMFVLGMLAAVILALAGALSAISPVLGALVWVPAYFVLAVLFMYVMLGFYYRAHRDIFSEPAPPASATMI